MALLGTTISFSVSGDKAVQAALVNLGPRALASLARELKVEAEILVEKSKREVPVNLGHLRDSGLASEPEIGSNTASVTVGYGGASAPYALYVHEGTGPAVGKPAFMPPVAPFKAWAKRKLGDESLGYVIARAVGVKGLQPRKYLERPFLERQRGMLSRIARGLRKDFQ